MGRQMSIKENHSKPVWSNIKGHIGQRHLSLTGLLFALPAILYFLFVYTYPFINSIFLTFFDVKAKNVVFMGLRFYKRALTDVLFWRSLFNTFYLTFISVPITIIIALITAILMDKMRFRFFRNMLQIASLLPMMMSLVAAALIFQWMFDPVYGILNNFLAVLGFQRRGWLISPELVIPSLSAITIWLRIGFDATILLAGLQAIPSHYYEAALIDGASPFKSFLYITFPLLNPQLVLVLISEIIFTIKSFEQVFITTGGGPANSSRVIILHLYETAFKWFNFGEASVIAFLLFIMLMLLSIFQWVILRKKID
jgi:multiple sugar transport system permease protein